MKHCPHGHKTVPDGVGKWDETITLEEDNPWDVDYASYGQLMETGGRLILNSETYMNYK